ncbi:MAG: class I SAM-dependent methyltransferase [Gammaproteobacteria bacterium]|nr:class I SAM-dependent methyltransferase [Gammaproteobacteria bacterium]
MPNAYYADKIESIRDIMGARDVVLEDASLVVDGRAYPIVDDVIVLLDPASYPDGLKRRLGISTGDDPTGDVDEEVQYGFGAEWQRYSEIKPEYARVFDEYFDIVDMAALNGARVCDLGCGIGRWTYFLNQKTVPREAILVDFSEAIFVARHNLRDSHNSLFFMGDIENLPFRENFADFMYSIGVLHHIPTDCLDTVRGLKGYAPTILAYLYYALDNRPAYFRICLAVVTAVRKIVSRIHSPAFRELFTWLVASTVYAPLCYLGRMVKPFGLIRFIPLAGEHHYLNFRWWRLLVYDRFFTTVEQRVTRRQIMELKDTFSDVIVSPGPSYWHFLCKR